MHANVKGSIEIEGHRDRPGSPLEADRLGATVIYHKLPLVPSMSVADNILLGRPVTTEGKVKNLTQTTQAQRMLRQMSVDIDAGDKHEAYQLMKEWTSQRIVFILMTSEMPELLATSDRIVGMHLGLITAERVLEAAMGTQTGIMHR